MIAIAKPLITHFHLPRFTFGAKLRRRQTTIDLIHSSPHLLRDIGLTEHTTTSRRR